jgi:phosphoribosylaminoimidazolecarboxamide formyltransferase / IMP cyclohydrolase
MDIPVKRAILSVSDKLGLGDFARGLADLGVELYSTGGTRRHLETFGLKVQDIAAYTGFPEMMDGRLKTLHPKIFGGILCRHDQPDDMQALAAHGILPFELVVVNLYPFEATVARREVTLEEAIEQIDIGGPSLVRAAAKNHAFVSIVTNPEQYSAVLQEITDHGHVSAALRRRLAAEAFARTALYDRAIADYFMGEMEHAPFPSSVSLLLQRKAELRYGENPHQGAAVYRQVGANGPSLLTARQLNGKELSYNNLLDLDSALAIVRAIPTPAAAVIKHNNPCGAATGDSLSIAAQQALDGDPVSAFGSVLGFNQPVDAATAELLCTPGLFIEAIVAPAFDPAAVELLTTKPKWKSNVRLMQVGQLDAPPAARHYRFIEGGALVQDADVASEPEGEWKVVTSAQPSLSLMRDLRFGWYLCRFVKSNAIVLCQNEALVGVGAGQMSRVDSVDIAIRKAGTRAAGSILASDAFFPFPDSIQRAAQAGVAALIQPGGSVRDKEVIAACDDHGLPMIFTGRRHFKH